MTKNQKTTSLKNPPASTTSPSSSSLEFPCKPTDMAAKLHNMCVVTPASSVLLCVCVVFTRTTLNLPPLLALLPLPYLPRLSPLSRLCNLLSLSYLAYLSQLCCFLSPMPPVHVALYTPSPLRTARCNYHTHSNHVHGSPATSAPATSVRRPRPFNSTQHWTSHFSHTLTRQVTQEMHLCQPHQSTTTFATAPATRKRMQPCICQARSRHLLPLRALAIADQPQLHTQSQHQ